ncbi:MAG: uroporphyrinogen-III synthase [Nitrosomonadales bacterium]|nr:uroporphyrinogen-III synthase [Nitrosomonadales bacterium]
MTEQALAGLNIVVTRPREQAAGLIQRIQHLGGNALPFPLLEIEAAPDAQALQQQLSRLGQADIVIFISPNAVSHGMAAIAAAGGLPPALQIATVGHGSARALQELGVAKVIVPAERFDSEGLLAVPELQQVAGKRVMILRGDGGRELLGDTLKARGAVVEYVTCYVRRKHALDAAALRAARPDAITVTSSEALTHLWELLQGTEPAGAALFVPHPRIAELARRQGWRHIVVSGSGDDGLIASLVAWTDTERN